VSWAVTKTNPPAFEGAGGNTGKSGSHKVRNSIRQPDFGSNQAAAWVFRRMPTTAALHKSRIGSD